MNSMVRNLLLLSTFFVLPVFSFAQLSDNFSDEDFTNNPIWTGNTSDFIITNDSLHSNGPQASSTIYLSTANTLMDSAEWNFLLRLNFNPSSTNRVRVFLASDQQDLSGNLNGYYVQFGEAGTAPDSLDIFRQNGITVTKIFTGATGIMANTINAVRIRIIRHTGGTWDVFADKTGGTNLSAEGSFTDNSITSTSYFGVVCNYSTVSRYNLYYFDDFSISNIVTDTTKPTVQSVNVLSTTAIDVKFSEPVEINSAQLFSNYSVNNSIGNPASATRDASDLSLVHLTYSTAFTNATNYVITVSGVTDAANNAMNVYTFPFSFYAAGFNDILINELMPDPDPAVGLPPVEFVELYNKTSFPISLNGWKFSDASTTAIIPNVTIQPDSFLILCSSAVVDSFSAFSSVAGLISFPSLNNTGDSLSLMDNFNNVIHFVAYSSAWYQDNNKADGGWTLEMIDPLSPCGGSSNWHASLNTSGGTPGKRNSVYGSNPDTILPQLLRATLEDSNTVILYFSEPMDYSTLLLATNYVVNNSVGSPVTASAVSAGNVSVRLDFAQNFSPETVYVITASDINDCSGNLIGISNTAQFALPDSIQPNDIIINEILFNPRTGGYDFLELYNRSNHIVDLSQLNILEIDASDPQSILEQTAITSQHYLLFPQQFVVISENIQNIQQNYLVENPAALLQVSSLPNFPDDDGICVLQTSNSIMIDSLSFSNKWHFALLDIEDGVSLERIDYNKPTQDKSNWHSAASSVGFATPTYQNSQFSETGITDDEIKINPEVFTPDNDGEKDFTYVSYKFSESGYMMNAKVYDAKGREFRTLVKSELLSSEGKFMWDGIDDDNQKARVGIYIIYLEIFNLQGKVKKFKKQVVLGAKLN